MSFEGGLKKSNPSHQAGLVNLARPSAMRGKSAILPEIQFDAI
jgi:hypothetical protein